jgi:hypothetical protein
MEASLVLKIGSISWSETSLVSIKYFLSAVTDIVTCCLFNSCAAFEEGNISLITLGLLKVETIRKNKRRKNIMSFSEEVLTSGLKCLFLLIFMSDCF